MVVSCGRAAACWAQIGTCRGCASRAAPAELGKQAKHTRPHTQVPRQGCCRVRLKAEQHAKAARTRSKEMKPSLNLWQDTVVPSPSTASGPTVRKSQSITSSVSMNALSATLAPCAAQTGHGPLANSCRMLHARSQVQSGFGQGGGSARRAAGLCGGKSLTHHGAVEPVEQDGALEVAQEVKVLDLRQAADSSSLGSHKLTYTWKRGAPWRHRTS